MRALNLLYVLLQGDCYLGGLEECKITILWWVIASICLYYIWSFCIKEAILKQILPIEVPIIECAVLSYFFWAKIWFSLWVLTIMNKSNVCGSKKLHWCQMKIWSFPIRWLLRFSHCMRYSLKVCLYAVACPQLISRFCKGWVRPNPNSMMVLESI